ncbi:unnamed protein product, partial [Rotaria sp. Silwood2]
WPAIPPQLSLIMKNVNVRIDFIEFNNEVKSLVPDVKNVIRMNNHASCVCYLKLINYR